MLQSSRSSTHQQTGETSESRKPQNKVDQKDLTQHFHRKTGPDVSADTAAAPIPTVVTDVGTAFLRLRAEQHDHTDDTDFQIVKEALNLLRTPNKRHALRKMTTDARGKPPTIRRHFKGRFQRTRRFPCPQEKRQVQFNIAHNWTTYHTKLLALAQARRWLPTTERLGAIEAAPPTPKTNFQLADAIKHPMTAEYAPFGHDVEDPDAYSPTISRLLLYAEIHNCKDHDYGTFSTPCQEMPYTYRQLQEWIVERRRRQASDATEGASRQLAKSAEDLATKLCEFASDSIVVRHLIEFALPSKKRGSAAEVTPKAASAPLENRSKRRDDATEHTKDTGDDAKQPDDRRKSTGDAIEHATDTCDDSTPEAASATLENRSKRRGDATDSGDDTKQPDDRRKTTGDATEHATRQKTQLKKHDDSHKTDSHDVTLSQRTAKAMAESFFRFVEQEHLQQHLGPMSAGQIVVLCIFHNRLSWQKGNPLQLHDRDQYWIAKPTYTPTSQVQVPSPPHFVEQLRANATEHGPPEMQPPRTCCLCGKGFIDSPALWRHCEDEHHSWAEAVKRILWEDEQLEAIPLLPPDKRRIIQNFTNALTYSKQAEGHFGRNKVCMRQLVGCATCARVLWINKCFPCHLFADCPDALRPREKDSDKDSDNEAVTEDSSDEETPATEQRRGKLLKDEDGFYVIDAHAIHELLDVNKYIEAWPQIPREELHASSVQHPSHPEYRWLLNTRRIPLQASTEGVVATEHELPKCAGVGIKDKPVWLCRSCTFAFCRPEPNMPFFALANWNWGGRLHPLYYNLSIATQALLGLAIMVCRLIDIANTRMTKRKAS
jgi:hypothetical protein